MAWDWEEGPPPAMQRSMTDYVLGQAGGYMQPGFNLAQYGLFGQNVPMGEDALDWEKDATNLAQDQLAMISDPMTAILSGAGGFAPEAWEPTVTYETVPRPGYDFLARQIRKAPVVDPASGQPMVDPNTGMPVMGPAREQTFSGLVADEMLNQQGSSTTAMSKIKTLIQDWDDQGVGQDPEHPDYGRYQMLVNSLPSMQSEFAMPGDPPAIDWMQAQNDAEMWEIAYHEDPKAGQAGAAVYDEAGNVVSTGEQGINEVRYDAGGNQILVQRKEEPTPTMELFAEYGLPMPTDRYEVADFMGPDWAAQNQAYQAAESEFDAMRRMLRTGGTIGGQEWGGRPAMRQQRRGMNQAEQDWQAAVAEYRQQTPEGEPLPGPYDVGGRLNNLNVDLLPPEWQEDFRASQQKLAQERGGPVQAQGTVGTQINWNPGEALRTAGGLARSPGGAAASAAQRTGGLPYMAPGATVSSMIARALGAEPGGGGEGALSPEKQKQLDEANRLRKRYEKRKSTYQGTREQYRGLQNQWSGLGETLEGAQGELYGEEWGANLARAQLLNQQGRTPYTDALMQRRMVPMAMGVQQSAWTGY